MNIQRGLIDHKNKIVTIYRLCKYTHSSFWPMFGVMFNLKDLLINIKGLD